MIQTLNAQLGKRSGHYNFSVRSLSVQGDLPFMTASFLNGIRRSLAEQLDKMPVEAYPLYRGVKSPETGFKLEYSSNGELMRTKYCIRHELGLCPKQGKVKTNEPLFLRNGKERLKLTFNCSVCEMTVTES